MVGTAPVTIILALSQFIDGYIGHGIAWIIIGSVAGVSDNVVKPFVIRSGVNIHPFLGLLSVLGGMTLLGVPGLFLGPFIAGLFTTCTPILWDVDR